MPGTYRERVSRYSEQGRYEYAATREQGGIVRALLFFLLMFVIMTTGFWSLFNPWGLFLTGGIFLAGLVLSRWWSVVFGAALGFILYFYLWLSNINILHILSGGLLG